MEDYENNQLLEKYVDFSNNILPVYSPMLEKQSLYENFVDKVKNILS